MASTVVEDGGFFSASESGEVHDGSELDDGEVSYVGSLLPELTTPPKKRYSVKYGTHAGAQWTGLRGFCFKQEQGSPSCKKKGVCGIGYKGTFSVMGEQARLPASS